MPVYTDYEPIPDDNQAAAPVGAPEGGYKGSVVNDTFRYMMAVIRNLGDGVLQLDGTTSPTAAINFGGQRINNLGESAAARLSAAQNAAVQDTTMNWGGQTTGSSSAYVVQLLPLFTGSTYRTGQQVRFIAHTSNTVPSPTLNAGTPGAKTLIHRDGTTAFRTGDITGGRRYTAEFDGTNWRVLDAGGYMEQATYDQLYPVGRTMLEGSTGNPNAILPAGVTATWTLETSDNLYLRGTTGTPVQTGGSFTSDAAGGHAHSFSATTSGPSPTQAVGGGAGASGTADHTHTVSGNTGSVGNHNHTINPPFVTYRLWRRTA